MTKVCQSDDIHSYKHVIVINITAIDLYILHQISTRQTQMNHIGLGCMITAYSDNLTLTTRFELHFIYKTRGYDSKLGTCIPYSISV